MNDPSEADWSLEPYLQEALAHERVLEDEESVLEQARSGDVKARQRLVRSHLHRAAHIALRLAPPTMSSLDAVQEANLVLLRLAAAPHDAPMIKELETAIAKHFESIK